METGGNSTGGAGSFQILGAPVDLPPRRHHICPGALLSPQRFPRRPCRLCGRRIG